MNQRRGRLTHLVGFDDAPFERSHRGDVLLVGAVYAGARLIGVLSGKVRRDGVNSTVAIARAVRDSRFWPQLHAVLLQGISVAGFNVVDIDLLSQMLQRPVLVVSRRRPNMAAIRRALLEHVPGGSRKWALIEKAGPVESMTGLWVQRAGLSLDQVAQVLRDSCCNGNVPEPLRTAHLIAGGIVRGESRGRV
jgi:endonuclease V-like protein UPF0215 family